MEKERVLSDLRDYATMNGMDLMPLIKPSDPSLNEEVSVPGMLGEFLNDSELVGGSCPPDIEVALLRSTVFIPMKIICDFALVLQPYMILIGTFYGAFAFVRIGFVG